MTRSDSQRAHQKSSLAGLGVAATLLLSACGGNTGDQGAEPAPTGGGMEDSFGHIHGLALDPETEDLLVATHYGLFEFGGEQPEQVSPTKDFMGFAVAGPGHYYASGHPGQGSDLPDPMGLIESTDGGETWQEVSRQGESDFHAMATSSEGIIGFDGALRVTPDGEEWTEVDTNLHVAHLSASPESPVALATTEEGVQRSTDGGLTWERVDDGPVLLLTAFADTEDAVGVTPEGAVYLSTDAGSSWAPTGGTTAQPVAITATTDEEENLQIWVATQDGLKTSDDGGETFSLMVPVAG
jgi:hypothetical protein